MTSPINANYEMDVSTNNIYQNILKVKVLNKNTKNTEPTFAGSTAKSGVRSAISTVFDTNLSY